MLELRELRPEDARALYECLQEIPPENGLQNGAYGMDYDTYVNKEIPRCIRYSKGEDLKPGHVRDTYYFLWDDGRPVAWFKLRHWLTETLKNGGGHIGYGVRISERGKGYAVKGLAMVVSIARVIIPEDEIYMACNKDNAASLKVMLSNGAYIHHEDDKEYFTRIPK